MYCSWNNAFFFDPNCWLSKNVKADSKLNHVCEISFDGQGKTYDAINVLMPSEWTVRSDMKTANGLYDQEKNEIGYINVFAYSEDFDLRQQQPNHSEITNDEIIDLPLGKVRILTLDADNGSAASGKTGTHDRYLATITVKNKVIYYFELISNDNRGELKPILIDMLRSLTISD